MAPVAIVTVEIRADPGDRSMDGLPKDIVSPDAVGEIDPVTLTVLVSPRLVNVIVEVVEPPARKLVGDAGPATRIKSAVTVTLNVELCDTEPLVPTTMTV